MAMDAATRASLDIHRARDGGTAHTLLAAVKHTVTPAGAADAASELEIIKWWSNGHNGGEMTFGRDGMLYITSGDGTSDSDGNNTGQDITDLNSGLLRLDVDHPAPGKTFSIPKDNPFVGKSGAAGEIWAYGVRNIWRLAFDKVTGACWAADVGQDIWEEINLVVKGGNYGWNKREGMHKFRKNGLPPSPEFIEPIWEYHHDIGRSITGGHVYHGSRLPELKGNYIALFFSTASCTAARGFTKLLCGVYRRLKGAMKPFEVIYVSADGSYQEFTQHFASMPHERTFGAGRLTGTADDGSIKILKSSNTARIAATMADSDTVKISSTSSRTSAYGRSPIEPRRPSAMVGGEPCTPTRTPP